MKRRALFPLLLCLGLGVSCAATDTGGDDLGDGGTSTTDDGGGDGADLGEALCFSGTPRTEPELLNQCTDAEHVDRPHRIPSRDWDGMGPLPAAP